MLAHVLVSKSSKGMVWSFRCNLAACHEKRELIGGAVKVIALSASVPSAIAAGLC